MVLTKADIIQAVVDEIGFKKKKSTEIVETLIEIIKSKLQDGEDVLVSGFGKFQKILDSLMVFLTQIYRKFHLFQRLAVDNQILKFSGRRHQRGG